MKLLHELKQLALALLTSLLFFGVASAQDDGAGVNSKFCSGEGAGTDFCNEVGKSSTDTKNNSLLGSDGILTQVAEILVAITAAASVIVIIVAGLMFIFGSNNPESVKRARNAVLYAIIGLIIALISQTIVIFVLKKL